MNSNRYAIITENLTKEFGKLKAVKNLSLKIPSGITFGYLGPNGAGKTTTIRLLNTIIKPSFGTAKVAGYDINSEKEKVKSKTGFLPESPGLYEKLTAREFLEFIGSLYYLEYNILSPRIDELLKIFGLQDKEYDLLEGYSRGMKQKVCLCAALIHDPEIIFLDEPTANLDPVAAKMVKSLISSLVKKANKTLFICTHFLDVAQDLCDIIGIINDGELKIQGSPQEIIASTCTENLEEAYLKIMGAQINNNLLSWRY
jgi:ABC-2 type transport system ATP-binding protein